MDLILLVLLFILMPIAIYIIFMAIHKDVKKKEKTMSSDSFIITQSRFTFWLGVVFSLINMILIALMIIFLNGTENIWAYLGFSLFASAGMIIIVYAIRWKVKVENDNIYFTPIIGKQRNVIFSDITKIKTYYNNKYYQGVKIYVNGRKLVSIESNCIGYNTMLERLQDQLPSLFSF